jgi:hypothetical protein
MNQNIPEIIDSMFDTDPSPMMGPDLTDVSDNEEPTFEELEDDLDDVYEDDADEDDYTGDDTPYDDISDMSDDT